MLRRAPLFALPAGPASIFLFVIDEEAAQEINKLFCEVVIAPAYDAKSVEILKSKPNRIILVQKHVKLSDKSFRTLLNGVIEQDKDLKTETPKDFKPATTKSPTAAEVTDLIFANKLVKHTKSNTIVLAKNGQLLASGTGQTSRVDALKQAIAKAVSLGFDLKGAVMASDAFFPFPDCVEIAHKAGITAVVQPGSHRCLARARYPGWGLIGAWLVPGSRGRVSSVPGSCLVPGVGSDAG